MYFKLEYVIREIILPPEIVLRFAVQGDQYLVNVELRAPNEEEQKEGHPPEYVFCTSYAELKVSSRNQKVFEKIENNEVIDKHGEWRVRYKDNNGSDILLPSFSAFPEHFKSFITQIHLELSSAARIVVNALRWRLGIIGPHNPISTRGLFWSRDQLFWHPAPAATAIILMDSAVSISAIEYAKAEKDINNIVNASLEEPLYHELFREAWGQRYENNRSSLLIAVSALEVAIKTTIKALAPNTGWLVENLPTPPVNRLLVEYIPNLPVRNKIKGKAAPPPERIINLIKKAVNIRNRIAHIGAKSLDDEALAQMLEAIKDILWLLDYYCGYKWAYQHIRKETRAELENYRGSICS